MFTGFTATAQSTVPLKSIMLFSMLLYVICIIIFSFFNFVYLERFRIQETRHFCHAVCRACIAYLTENCITARGRLGAGLLDVTCTGAASPLLSQLILLSSGCVTGVWSKRQKSTNSETYNGTTSPSIDRFIERTISCSCDSDMLDSKFYSHSPCLILQFAASRFILVDEIFTHWITSCIIYLKGCRACSYWYLLRVFFCLFFNIVLFWWFNIFVAPQALIAKVTAW